MAVSIADQVELDRVRAALQKRRDGGKLSAGEVSAIRRYEERRAAEQWRSRARRLPQSEVLNLFGINAEQAQRWKIAGLPTEYEGRNVFYNLSTTIDWLKRRWQGGQVGDGPEFSKRRAEIELLIARRVHLELKTRLANGELRARGDVERENCGKIVAFRSGLLALVRTLTPAILELGLDPDRDAVEGLISDHVTALLWHFAGGRPHEAARPVPHSEDQLVASRTGGVADASLPEIERGQTHEGSGTTRTHPAT